MDHIETIVRQAETLSEIALSHLKLFELQQAAEFAQQLSDLLSQHKDEFFDDIPRWVSLNAESKKILGGVINRQGDPQRALQYFNEALTQFNQINDSKGIADTYLWTGVAYGTQGRRDLSEPQFRKALEIYEQLDNQPAISLCLSNISVAYRTRSEYQLALEYLERAVKISEGLGNNDAIARDLNLMAVTLEAIEDYGGAIVCFERALRIYKENNNEAGVAQLIQNIGGLYFSTKDFQRALEFYRQGLELNRLLEIPHAIASALNDIACAYSKLGSIDLAIEHWNEALIANERSGDLYGVGENLSNLGSAYCDIGDYKRALDCIARSIEIARDIQDNAGLATRTFHLGTLYATPEYTGYDPVKAEQLFFQAESMYNSQGTPAHNIALYEHMNLLCEQQERWKESREYIEKRHHLETSFISDLAKKTIENFNVRLATAAKEREESELLLKAERFERQVQHQRRELSNKTLQLVKQTDMLQRFRTELETILHRARSAESAIREVQKKVRGLRVQSSIIAQFNEEFSTVYQDFEVRLMQACPTISAMEMKVCRLLFIGMPTRDVAALLSLSERTVDFHRGRIRRKLGLQRNVDVSTALRTIFEVKSAG